MELHKQAEQLREMGIKLIKQGKLEEAKQVLESAIRKFKLAVEYSDGIAKEIRLERIRECEKLIREIDNKLSSRHIIRDTKEKVEDKKKD